MTNQQQYEQTWDMRKKYEAIVKIVKLCEDIKHDNAYSEDGKAYASAVAYKSIKDIVEEDLK